MSVRDFVGSMLIVLAVGACGDNLSSPTHVESISISTGSLVPSFTAQVHEYTATSLTSLAPVGVKVTAPGASELAINGQAATSGDELGVQLAPLEDIEIDADGVDYVIHYAPADLPTMRVTTSDAAGSEPILMSPGNSMLLIVDRAGQPLYYREDGAFYVDFAVQTTPDLGPVYTYLTAPAGSEQLFQSVEGTRHVMDTQFHELEVAPVIANGDHPVLDADAHDFLLLSADHYVGMSYVAQTVDMSGLDPTWSSHATVVANVVQEVNGGAATLEWRNTDDPELYLDSVSGNTFDDIALSDYTHLNSIEIDPDDQNLILSLRHADEVIELDRTTGEKLWTLGGLGDEMGLTEDQKFSHQHFVKKQADGTLLLFDNGNGKHQTRILQIGIDEASKTLTSYETIYTKPLEERSTDFMGSVVQPSPGRYLIGWGGGMFGPRSLAVTELVDGEVAWTLAFDDATVQSYRALPGLAP